MWPFELFAELATNTNTYASHKNANSSQSCHWKEVNIRELLIWIRFILYKRVFTQRRPTAKLWFCNNEYLSHCISRFLSQNCFEQIKKFLHIGGENTYQLLQERFFKKLDLLASQL